MNRAKLKNYAPQARRDFIQAVTDRAAVFGVRPGRPVSEVTPSGDAVLIEGREFPKAIIPLRGALVARVHADGFAATMEKVAYTWFNRLVALRYMELHGYLDHGCRVLSNPKDDLAGKKFLNPEILERAEHLDLPNRLRVEVIQLKLAGNRDEQLYRLLLLWQCDELRKALPLLFEQVVGEAELLMPDNLLHTDSLIRKLVGEIDEEDWQPVEIIGWLYQFYISEKKDEVIGKVVASEDIPAATQLFTPNWIVKYLVQNTLGRQWLATYPQSPLRQQMAYYIEPAEQTPEVQAQLKAITPTSLNPEDLTMLDPACGSGHILVEGYDLFKAIYTERGYNKREIPRLILEKNLFGLEIDDRAAQLASFALMMKARADDRRIFESEVKPNVVALQESEATFDADTLPDEFAPQLNTIEKIVALFRNAKTFGSLIQVPADVAARIEELEAILRECLKQGSLVSNVSARHILELLRQLRMLARQYDVVVANPPYMGSKYFNNLIKEYVKHEYRTAKADICIAFIERGLAFTSRSGLMGMVTMQSWMFLSSFEEFRVALMQDRTIQTMIHLGPYAFPEIGGHVVQVTAFVVSPQEMQDYRGSYRRLIEGQSHEKEARFHTTKTYTTSNSDFAIIPGKPVAYWANQRAIQTFRTFPPMSDMATPRAGMITSNNALFVRLWHEVSQDKFGRGFISRAEAQQSGLKWFPYQKGGTYRKWYGNNDCVVNWHNDGHDIRTRQDDTGRIPAHAFNEEYIFQPNVNWSAVTASGLSVRITRYGSLFDAGGSAAFPAHADVSYLASFLNSPITQYLIGVLNPTVNFQAWDIAKLPVKFDSTEFRHVVSAIADTAASVAKLDWDSFETSWDFGTLPIIQHKSTFLRQSQETADAECLARFARMKQLEEENNRLFIDAYGLQDELTPDVLDDQITLYRPDRKNDIQRLLSYAIGCMMGRYSLDKPGLVYAHSGNQGFDHDQYKTFRADDDGIVPLLETDWGIRDDAANRFVEFIGAAWPKEHLDENLKFVAESLGTNTGEQPRDTIRRYLATGFFKHHLSMYKKRPIYWLFSSGKQRAFQCVVYLHRYHESTLARMRTEYVIPLQGKLASRIDQLEGDKLKATSTSHRKKLQKEQDDLKKQQIELAAFEEKLKHAADQKITLDLDDGVKVNYAKFGDLLAESKAICGSKDDE